MDNYKQRWRVLAPAGLLLVGAGISVLGEAITAKGRGDSAEKWLPVGTAGLTLLNSGLALFGESVKQRLLFELDATRSRPT
jgi:hypothetical protein